MTVRADVERLPPAADAAPVAELVEGLRTFALRLAASASGPGTGNLVVSPVSIALAFAMVEAGAGDDGTAADIATAFGFPDPPGLHEAMNALSAQLQAVGHKGHEGSDGVTLDVANAIWGQEGLDFGAPFLATLAAHYGAGVETVDYVGNAEAARQEINAWVSEVTRARIPELLPTGAFDASTLVAIVNAIYLDAAWRTPFDKALTTDQPFTLGDGIAVVPTMHHERLATMATVVDGFAAVKLPYQGNDLAMVVIVPQGSTTLVAFEAELTGDGLARIVAGLSRAHVDLTMPRWEATTALDLADPLSALGLRIPGGDLSGIAPGAFIGAAVHAANITVDEKRTVAAAATAVMVGRAAASAPPQLRIAVDRPFLFVVQHEATGAPLFYGRIADPRS
jgi:serpin B